MSIKGIIMMSAMLSVHVACRHQPAPSDELVELASDGEQKAYAPFIFAIDLRDTTSVAIHTGEGEFNYGVDWDNDGIFDETNLTDSVSHDYKELGTYTIRIRGQFPHMLARQDDGGSNLCGMKVLQWGDIQWKSMTRMFADCRTVSPTFPRSDAPDLSQVTDMSWMFANAKTLNEPLNHWDVSHIHEMVQVFYDAEAFNQPLDQWDVSQVTTMYGMFSGAETFNQPLASWNVGHVTDMSSMFFDAEAFNQPLDAWDVSHVTEMSSMFGGADAFNQPLNSWDVSRVVEMSYMFDHTKAFNQPLNSWDVSHVTRMNGMFADATAFNQSLGSWTISGVEEMGDMLNDCGMDTSNYDATLMGWAAQLPMPPHTPGVNAMTYCHAEEARHHLIDAGWNIYQDSKQCD